MNLTPRELEILDLFAAGHSNRMIAHRLQISVIAVADSIAVLYRKLGAHDRESAAAAWVRAQEREVGK